jgi:hypothetical protein
MIKKLLILVIIAIFNRFVLGQEIIYSKPNDLDFSSLRQMGKIGLYPIYNTENNPNSDYEYFRSRYLNSPLFDQQSFWVKSVLYTKDTTQNAAVCAAYEFLLKKLDKQNKITIESPYRMSNIIILDMLDYKDAESFLISKIGAVAYASSVKDYPNVTPESYASRVKYIEIKDTDLLDKLLLKRDNSLKKPIQFLSFQAGFFSQYLKTINAENLVYSYTGSRDNRLSYSRRTNPKSSFLYQIDIARSQVKMTSYINQGIKTEESTEEYDSDGDLFKRVYYLSNYKESQSFSQYSVSFGLHKIIGNMGQLKKGNSFVTVGCNLGLSFLSNPEISYSADTFAIASLYSQYTNDTIFNGLYGNQMTLGFNGMQRNKNIITPQLLFHVPFQFFYFLNDYIYFTSNASVTYLQRLNNYNQNNHIIYRNEREEIINNGIMSFYDIKSVMLISFGMGLGIKL